MLRELAPLITAIIVAGRTGSAYTAQIGTMQVTEEVDALRTIGISADGFAGVAQTAGADYRFAAADRVRRRAERVRRDGHGAGAAGGELQRFPRSLSHRW
jgi:hypothetical protein